MKNTDTHHWQELSKENPFRVPENYFKEFPTRVMEAIEEESREVTPVRKMRPVIRWISAVAAVLIMGFVGLQQFVLKPGQERMAENAMFEVIEYYAMGMDDWTMTELMAENEVLGTSLEEEQIQILEWMDLDEMTLIDAFMNDSY